jgi:hypothetical protein
VKYEEKSYDVVVVGAGLAGVSAAIAAARHGASACLVQDRPVLGGNSSSEIRVTPHGAAAFHGYARETGIVSEALIEERATNHETITENGWTNSVWDLALYDMVVRTEGLDLMLNTTVEGVTTGPGNAIAAVDARVGNAERVCRLSAETFIDSTGDGTVAALAGADWRAGTESREEFGEPHAPERETDEVMGSSLHFKTVDTGRPIEFHAPEWAVKYEDSSFFYEGGRVPKTLRSGYWWIEIGPPFDTIHDNERIRHELTRHVLGIWDYIKNRDENLRERATNLALDWVGQVPGKRESRRIRGKTLLNENELIQRKEFPDEVAFGGWYVDLHTLGGLLAGTSEPLNARELDPTSDYGASTNVGPFGIPLSIMLAEQVPNLMMAGRNVSATHAAMGSIRVMSTGALMGQATGTAAALARSTGSSLAEVARDRVRELQQELLRDGVFLPNRRNEDPDDLALGADVVASSEEALQGVGPSSADWLNDLGQWTDHPVFPATGRLEHRTAQWIALGDRQDLESLELCLSSLGDGPQQVRVSLYAVEDIWDYRTEAGEPLAVTTLDVPSAEPTWIAWDLTGEVDAAALPRHGYIRVDLEANPAAEWHMAGTVQPGNIAGYEASPGRYRRFGGGTTMSFTVRPPQRCYPAENVVNGVTRPHRFTNAWRSDPVKPLPQSITLSWERPEEISQVQLTFAGHLLREYHAYPPQYRDPQTPRDYSVQVLDEAGTWKKVLGVEGNYTTRNVHTFDRPVTASALRVVVTATNGDPSASIYEIRCYGEPLCKEPAFAPSGSAR